MVKVRSWVGLDVHARSVEPMGGGASSRMGQGSSPIRSSRERPS